MILAYNWDSHPETINYLKRIYRNTLNYLKDNNYPLEYAKEFTDDIEDYLYYFKLKKYDVNLILSKLKDLETIEFYESLYISKDNIDSNIPPVINRYIKILLSTYITGDKKLSSKERRRLYLYQGLSKNIISLKTKKTLLFSKFYDRYLTSTSSEAVVNNGWLLLEDTLAQELAEKITYQTLGKIRPGYKPGLANEVYPIDENKVSSNLEMYRMFQELVIHFGLTIGRLNNSYDYSSTSILDNMIKYSITNTLSDQVLMEYMENDKLLELYQLLYLMGLLVNEKYREYKMNFISHKLTKEEVNKIYDNIINLTSTLINIDNSDTPHVELSNLIVLYDEETKEKIRRLIQDNEI